jgi:hypothetical protein
MGSRFMPVATAAVALAALVGSAGCSSVGASAIHTGPLRLPPRSGPVAIYVVGHPMKGQDLGLVEVHAAQSEANIETLLPVFAQKVAQLGGNAAVIEKVSAEFGMRTHLQMETYSYPCGYYTCIGTRSYPVYSEIMYLQMAGHAFQAPLAPAAPGVPGVVPQ